MLSFDALEALQPRAWQRLVALQGRLPHAILLHGAPGLGKLQLAERFAQLILCEQRRSGEARPCGSCASCRWIGAGSHPDIRFLEPGTFARSDAGDGPGEDDSVDSDARKERKKPSAEIRIEQVRSLADFINIGSHRGGRRLAVVQPAEDLNAAAANALLKSLEEPPAGAVFLLVSHRPSRLLPTVRSRCVPVPVDTPPEKASQAWLRAQGVQEAARWLAYCGGAPRLALELATGDLGSVLAGLRTELCAGNPGALRAAANREQMVLLVDLLQKYAYDRACQALAGRSKYGLASDVKVTAREGRAWLSYARSLGVSRRLARHPLNPALYAADLLARMPELGPIR